MVRPQRETQPLRSLSYLWIGDSNAGTGTATSTGSRYGATLTGAKIFHKPDRTSTDNGSWQEYVAWKNSYPGGLLNGPPFLLGPQHSFLEYLLANQTRPVRLYKLAKGGSSLQTQTSTDNDWIKTNGELYTAAISYMYGVGITRLPVKETSTLKACIIQLGTNDAQSSIYTSNFASDYKTLIANIRTDLGLPNLKMVLVKVRANLNVEGAAAGTRTQAANVRTGIASLVDSLSPNYVANTVLIEVDDLTIQADGLHFDESSIYTLGQRVAAEVINY